MRNFGQLRRVAQSYGLDEGECAEFMELFEPLMRAGDMMAAQLNDTPNPSHRAVLQKAGSCICEPCSTIHHHRRNPMADKPAKIQLVSPVGIGHFVQCVTARAIEEGGKAYFSILLALKKGHPQVEEFMKRLRGAIAQAARAKWGKDIPAAQLKHYPITDGDDAKHADRPELHGRWLLSIKNGFKPHCVDRNGNDLVTVDDLYSGAKYKVCMSPWAWSHKTGGRGVSLNLNSVLKWDEGERIGGGADARADFAGDITAPTEGAEEPAEADSDQPPF